MNVTSSRVGIRWKLKLKDHIQSPIVICGVHKALIWQGKHGHLCCPLLYSFPLFCMKAADGLILGKIMKTKMFDYKALTSFMGIIYPSS